MKDTQSTSSRPTKNYELIAAITLCLLAVACFILQALSMSPTTSRVETALFSCLQFLLTAGFTWFSTRAVSRHEFEQSMKRYAISAYRRIADIERLVSRLQRVVGKMITEDAETNNLSVIEAMVSDAEQIVRSSIADWADVIGEELLAIEKIKRLEQEKVELSEEKPDHSKPSEYDEALKGLNDQIADLKSRLPARLQFVASDSDERSASDRHAADWMAGQHKRERGLRLTVVTGDEYTYDREFSTLGIGEILHTVKSQENEALDVVDVSGKILGRLQNNSPLDYDQFAQALENCFGKTPLSLKVIEILGSETRGKFRYSWFSVRVLSELQEKEEKHRKRRRTSKELRSNISHLPAQD